MSIIRALFIAGITIISFPLRAGNGFCGVYNTAFMPGESMTFKVMYAVVGAHFGVGEATFTASQETMFNQTVYHVVGEGKTYPFYDNVFKVRDRYESYIDTATLQPYKFIRNVLEGDYRKYENVTFNPTMNTAITNNGVFLTPECIQDVISAIYYSRNIDFKKYRPGDKIPFSIFLDNEVFNMYIRYLGKETIKTHYGKFRTIKFKPLLIRGTIFEGGEKMTVWVSDDQNHVPVKVESPISVGSVKVELLTYRNLRYPLTSLLSLRGY